MFTIFTAPKKSSFYSGVRPADFFALLHKHNVRKIIDIRRSAAMCDNAIFQERVLPWCCEKENIIYEISLLIIWFMLFLIQRKSCTSGMQS